MDLFSAKLLSYIRPSQINKKVNNTNALFSAPLAHVCRNATLAHDVSLGANNQERYLHLPDVSD